MHKRKCSVTSIPLEGCKFNNKLLLLPGNLSFLFGGLVGLDAGTGWDTVVGRALRLQAGVSVTASLVTVHILRNQNYWDYYPPPYFPILK